MHLVHFRFASIRKAFSTKSEEPFSQGTHHETVQATPFQISAVFFLLLIDGAAYFMSHKRIKSKPTISRHAVKVG